MSNLLPVLIMIAMAAVVGVLATGVVSMVRGGEFNRKYGNRLMRWRVILQFTAVMLVLLYFLTHGT
jgi:hypothetical protein